MGKRGNLNLILAVIIIVVMFLYLRSYAPAGLNIDVTVAPGLLNLLPAFIVIIACIYVTARTYGIGRLGGTIGIGIGFCYLFYLSDVEGLLTVEMLSGLTIPQLQLWTMIISTVAGAVLSTQ